MTSKGKKSRFLYKFTVLGPEDILLEKVLSIFDETLVSVDGIRIGSSGVETDDSDVSAVFMSPRHSALDLLLSLSYTGANGAIIVMREADPAIETVYRNEIREKIGSGIPTRVVCIGDDVDEFKRTEVAQILEELIEEIQNSN
ncbi:MAG: hypothetical protein JSW61_11610 [Candidatus Thorarchaeota archaeon]|nr:MAG: hypothetical protein JSW61_11610 [Candidatus Thorarchaeota archaeon]